MMVVSDDPPKERGRHRSKVEGDMIRRREREFKHQQMWAGATDYYKRWDKINTKFDEWTSPRYYEDNNKMISEIRLKRDKEELLEKRRSKLKKLLEQEDASYQIELMMKKNLNIKEKQIQPSTDAISTEVLKDVNQELKRKEEEKRKREAELKLYHQWRINNPIVRQFESKYRFKDLKLSWLDQQIEKRIQKENEERECKLIIKEQEERLKREHEREEQMKREIEEKKVKLKQGLDEQIKELGEKQKLSNELRRKEDDELKCIQQLEELQEKSKEIEKKRIAKENALFNIKQHKLKLKQKALDVQEALAQDRDLIVKMRKLQLEELLEDEKKKLEIKQGLEEFLSIVKQQQDLELQRQRHLEFLFDSEAKAIYEKQLEMWKKEETARKQLLKEVLATVHKQIEENIQKSNIRQREILKEREEMMMKVEQYDRELQALREQDEARKKQRRKIIDDDIKVKNAMKKQQENMKLKEIDDELQRVKKEEERLNKEIMEIQRRQGSCRPTRKSRLFY